MVLYDIDIVINIFLLILMKWEVVYVHWEKEVWDHIMTYPKEAKKVKRKY